MPIFDRRGREFFFFSESCESEDEFLFLVLRLGVPAGCVLDLNARHAHHSTENVWSRVSTESQVAA